MKSWLKALFALASVMLLTLAGGTPAPESSFGSNSVVQLEPVAEPVLTLTDLPAEVLSLENGSITPISMTMPAAPPAAPAEPPPGLLPAKVTKPTIQAAPAVRQSYSSCGPGGCGVRRGLFGRRR